MQYDFFNDDQFGVGLVPDEVIGQLTILPLDHAAYFDLSLPHQLVPLSALVASRARATGIVNANVYMRRASQGEMAPRVPISIQPIKAGKVVVLDGNSTFLNALFSGWPDIPCKTVD